MTQSAEHPWSDERLDAFRQVGDQAADAVIAHVLDVHDVATINQMMRSLVRNVDLPLADLPEIVRDYLDETFMLPMWTRPDLLRRASAFFDLHGPEIVMLLLKLIILNFSAQSAVLHTSMHSVSSADRFTGNKAKVIKKESIYFLGFCLFFMRLVLQLFIGLE